MHQIQIDNITISNPKSHINNPINIDITFSALAALPYPLTWKIIYVGSAFTETHDQILEEFQIQNISEPSTLNFQLQCPSPDFTLLPREEVICTPMIISVQYLEQEFLRIGYYIYNTFLGEEDEGQLSLENVIQNAERFIIAQKPRITKFQIKWQKQSIQQQKEVHLQRQQQSLLQNQTPVLIKSQIQNDYNKHLSTLHQNHAVNNHIHSKQHNNNQQEIDNLNTTQEKLQTDAEKEKNV